MSSLAYKLPTFEEMYAEIEALPEGTTGEILGPGDLRVMPRPGGKHSFASMRAARALDGSNLLFGGTGWWIEVEREVRFPDDRLFVPDLAGWRVDEMPDFIEENPITVPPDWACEILSRSTQRADRVLKLPHYARNGVGHVWIVVPEARTIEVYESRGSVAALIATASGDDVVVLPPFDLPLDVGALWKPEKAPSTDKRPDDPG